jgi:hypothetical protein
MDTPPEHVHIYDISLIAPNILAAPCAGHSCIDILTFSTSQDMASPATPHQLKLRVLHRLMLPVQEPGPGGLQWKYDDIHARLHPLPSSSVPHRAKYSSAHPGSAMLPFETDAEDGIVVYSLRLVNTGTDQRMDFTLVVHRSALINPRGWSSVELSHAIENADERPLWSDMKARTSAKEVIGGQYKMLFDLFDFRKVHVPWREWGPKHTRWIDGVRNARWICWVHGHRLAEIEEREPPRRASRRSHAQSSNESRGAYQRAEKMVDRVARVFQRKYEALTPPDDPALYLRVWDFNPRAVRRALGTGVEWSLPAGSDARPSPGVAVEHGPTVVVERGAKPGPVDGAPGTCLPYILTTVKLDVAADRSTKRGVVMDGEHVILVGVRMVPFRYRSTGLNTDVRTRRRTTIPRSQRWWRYSVCR